MRWQVAGQVLSVVCAWCNRVIIASGSSALVSHSICPACIDVMTSPEAPDVLPVDSNCGDLFDAFPAHRTIPE